MRHIDRFYVVEFSGYRRIFVAVFEQVRVGDRLVERYLLGTLHIWRELKKCPDGTGHDYSLLALFKE